MKNILVFVLMLMPFLVLTSCLKDDEQVFDENSAHRMSKYLDNAKDVLVNGGTWLMEMYPEEEQGYGGYAFTLEFTKDSVAVRCELFYPTSEAKSLWKLTNDDGPVLTFDTYNSILHLFSTPGPRSTGNSVFPTLPGYTAFDGEFEWVIMDVSDSVIKLRGKKTGNTVYMYRMTEDPQTYLTQTNVMEEQIIFTGLRYTNGTDIINGIIDSDYRQIEFSSTNGEKETVAYTLTPTGLRLYKDVTMNGVTLREFTYKADAQGNPESMTSNGCVFAAVFPDGWQRYDAFAGDYTLNYYRDPIDVKLVPAGDGSTYYIKGMNPNYDIVAKYKKATGNLSITSQFVVKNGEPYVAANGNYVGFVSWAAAQGYISFNTGVGMTLVWNGDEEHPVYTFKDNGAWGTYSVTSYIIYYFTRTTLSSSYRVSLRVAEDYIGGSYQIPYLENLVKK